MTKCRWLLWIALLGLAGWSLPAAAAPEGFHTEKLKNGLTLKYKVMKGQPMVSVYAVIPNGMHGEKAKGVAHLLEHMVFRGGNGYSYNDIADVTNRVGGYFNGFTSFYATVFNYVTTKQRFPEALKVFNGSLWKPNLIEDVVKLERRIVLQELNMDYAERYAYYPIFNYFYPELSFSAQNVTDTTAADLQTFHQGYYQPENATYIVAGDIDPKQVIAELEGIENGLGRLREPTPPIVPFSLPRGEVVEQRNLYPYDYQLLMAYEFSGLSAKERLLLSLLSYAYGYDTKIDYERNHYKTYFAINRTVGDKDYFGLYYLERNEPFSEQAVAAEKSNLRRYFRQIRKVDFKRELKNFIKLVEMEAAESQVSAESAVEYEVQRLTSPENITVDALPLLKKLTQKDLEQLIDTRFNQPPTAWILVKTTK
jgi:predicted Zn-dependent peptidase